MVIFICYAFEKKLIILYLVIDIINKVLARRDQPKEITFTEE